MNRLIILLALGAAAIGGGTAFALSQKSQVAAQSVPAPPAPAAQASPIPTIRPQTAAPPVAAASPAPAAAPTTQSVTISTCNGSPAHANFREYPSFSPRSILGVVVIGELVRLTGRTVQANGERWYEAVNPAPLHPSLDVGAQNRTVANQVGWIAACFARG